jgi:L-ascorbate metabolism protein UlaG (beta-lactamase superfamily)
MVAAGIDAARIIHAEHGQPVSLGPDLEIHPVPSAHPRTERDPEGRNRWLGYVLRTGERNVYHAGDTSVDEEVISAVQVFEKIDVAFLPVNEKNYYRDRRGIVGNMSLREAFRFAEEIHAGIVVPMHWDMFEQNCTYREEIELLYAKLKPDFDLIIEPDAI